MPLNSQTWLDDALTAFQADYAELRAEVTRLAEENATQKRLVERLNSVVGRDSKLLGDYLYEKVYDAKVTASGGGLTTFSPVFDVSRQSKDAAGNPVYPHAFYIISAFAPSLTAGQASGPCVVVYQGTPIALNDISVFIERTAVASPTRFTSRLGVYKGTAGATFVHIKVLKLLGIR